MKEWKSGSYDAPLGDTRLWVEPSSPAHYYCLRIGWREIFITRGEVILTLSLGLMIGLIYAAAQAGYLHFPDTRPALAPYQAPKPVLLGSTERTRPEAGNPDTHFVDARGRLRHRHAPIADPVLKSEDPAPALAPVSETSAAQQAAPPASAETI